MKNKVRFTAVLAARCHELCDFMQKPSVQMKNHLQTIGDRFYFRNYFLFSRLPRPCRSPLSSCCEKRKSASSKSPHRRQKYGNFRQQIQYRRLQAKITDPDELKEIQRKKRKEFEDGIRKNRFANIIDEERVNRIPGTSSPTGSSMASGKSRSARSRYGRVTVDTIDFASYRIPKIACSALAPSSSALSMSTIDRSRSGYSTPRWRCGE